jgi:hypothetical protein
MSAMIDGTAPDQQATETLKVLLRRGAIIGAVLVVFVGLAAYLTSHADDRAARDRCTAAVRTQPGYPGGVEAVVGSTDRRGDDTYLVSGTADGRTFTCLVTREPFDDRWEVASVHF